MIYSSNQTVKSMIQIKTETNILKYLYTCICSWQNVLVSELKQILQFVISIFIDDFDE